MTFQQSGIKTYADIELKDFKWQVKKAWHDLEQDKSYVEVIAWEIHKKHSRTFEITTPEVWTTENVFAEVMKLDAFIGSTAVIES